MTDPLAPAFARASSRLAPPPTPVVSMLIHAGVVVVWVALFLLAFGQGGVFAWSVGLAYLVYDAVLQVFTGWQIRRITAARAAPQDTARSTLAVIVAAHNEATALPATLAALLDQDDPPDEILIADDGSTDGTADLLVAQFGLTAP
ncbi:MAG: glycosyltransferase, partial [Mycobacterium sp.]